MEDVNKEVVSPEFTKICGGLLGAEGPVFNTRGELFMVAPEVQVQDKPAGEILRIDLETSQASLICKPSFVGCGGIPAGCQCDREDNIWVADMRHGLLKVRPDGSVTQYCKTDKTGVTMQGCNDCSFDYSGSLWATAPAGNIAPEPYKRSSIKEPFGSVYCLTASGDVIKVDTGYAFCNGVAVQHTPDGRPKVLIVAETPTKLLWAYDIVGPGKVDSKRKWGELPGDQEGGPDGMDFDVEGNLLVANWGSSHLEVFGPEGGQPFCRIKCPSKNPSNIHFKPNSTEVFITEHEFHGLWKFNWKFEGKKQYCDTMNL